MNRYWLILYVVLTTAGASAQRTPRAVGQPNIVFILADDLGYGDLSGYGATDLQTPHIDSLLRAGIRFTDFYANSSVCSPSRAALLTGRYPERVGVPGVIRDDTTDSWGYLAPGLLLPDYLKRAGYHTALIGKWHLGLASPNLPNERGFAHFYGLLEGMVDDYVLKLRHGQNFMRENTRPIRPPGHATDVFTDAAVRYLAERRIKRPPNGRSGQPNQPFFLYLTYTAPHDPLQPPADYLARVQQRQPGIDPQRARLVALIEHLDAGVGRVLNALRTNGQLANTIVVFTSDNGGWGPGRANNGRAPDGQPYRGVKGQFYEGGIRVPAGAVWSGHIPAGRVSAARLQLMDWFPTLLGVAGVQPPKGGDGVGFGPLLTGSAGESALDSVLARRPMFWVRREGQDTYKGLQIHAVRRGDWKLLQPTPFAPYELYNLAGDPRETRNMADEETTTRDGLIKLLMEHIRQGGSVPWEKPAP